MPHSRFSQAAKAILASAALICAPGALAQDKEMPPKGATWPAPMSKAFDIVGETGSTIGTATLTQGPQGVMIRVEIGAGGLPEGWHGMHLHQVGDCSDPGKFTNSGGHVGKVEGGHGLFNPKGPEAGDLPNVYAQADGSVKAEVFTTFVSLAQGPKALMDSDGSALIFHAGPDDGLTQPIGGAGARLACAAIR